MNAIEKLRSKLELIQEEIDNLASEMQDTYDSRSERWQESEKGEEYQEKIDQLESASYSVGDAVDTLSEIESNGTAEIRWLHLGGCAPRIQK